MTYFRTCRPAGTPRTRLPGVTHMYVVADNYCIHKAKAVEQWLAKHPRFTLLWLPTYCPRANPIERVFGDVHDKCTRNHKRKRLRDVVQDVEWHVQANGPWQYRLCSYIKTQRSRPQSSTWLLRTKTRSPRECTNLMWADLVCPTPLALIAAPGPNTTSASI